MLHDCHQQTLAMLFHLLIDFLLELTHVAPNSEKQKGFIVKKQNNKRTWMVEPLKK